MLIDILRMPPIFGIPIDRRLTVYGNVEMPSFTMEPSVQWPSMPLYNDVLHTGSYISAAPRSVYKAIHVADQQPYVFETVFGQMDDGSYNCIYTKVIGVFSVEVAISLRCIDFYQNGIRNLIPLSRFVGTRANGNSINLPIPQDIDPVEYIVPPVFGEQDLFRHLHRILDIRSADAERERLGWLYKPIYDYVPSVMLSLIEGYFYRSPLMEVRGYHPSINLDHDKWFFYEEQAAKAEALGHRSFVNHREFDGIVLDIVRSPLTKINITSLMSHALDGISAVWMTKELRDDYGPFLRGPRTLREEAATSPRRGIEDIFYRCAMMYCRIAKIDYRVFTEGSVEKSSINISKNIYDEVAITVHDTVHGEYVSFYSTFPALALGTLGVGSYL
jgi:hypothetical protein